MKLTALVMAGGRGERFWPVSRERCPKQFLSLTDDGETLIQKTVRRLLPLVAPEDVYIAANAAYSGLIVAQLPEIPPENILTEPCSRNTAPCIGLAAGIFAKVYGDAVMLVLPSDHLIRDTALFCEDLRTAVHAAESGSLVTLGIPPAYPETGYGYLHCTPGEGCCKVTQFVEKPPRETAEQLVQSGKWLWNSGMFVWRVGAIRAALRIHQPMLYAQVETIADAWGKPSYADVLAANYPALPSVSVDYGVMEQAEDICAVPCRFGWEDMGSWRALERIGDADPEGNCLHGDVVTVDSTGCTVSGQEKLIAVLGLREIIIVDTPDALLVCSKHSTQDIKKLTAALRLQHRQVL
ncbi:MAG: NTP transferase domain-containing protein [Oscillospiraceae bacterium]|nr:NTP transferase domain-containing protein [Oscillospiraceae bacterium]